MSFTFDTNVKVDKDRNPEVHMVFDMLKLFKGTKTIDFTGNHNVHKPPTASMWRITSLLHSPSTTCINKNYLCLKLPASPHRGGALKGITNEKSWIISGAFFCFSCLHKGRCEINTYRFEKPPQSEPTYTFHKNPHYQRRRRAGKMLFNDPLLPGPVGGLLQLPCQRNCIHRSAARTQLA
ncbi:MAG: hypothetical protein IPI11_18405 [Haliscomenobacter sp.]|nr:hypothetical protein [Haliscomenobacter sp.]